MKMSKALCSTVAVVLLTGCVSPDDSAPGTASATQALEGCVCPFIQAPVCGSDGVSYGNWCFAECAGADVLHDGECSFECPLGDQPVCAYHPSTQSTATFSKTMEKLGIFLSIIGHSSIILMPSMRMLSVLMGWKCSWS